MGAREKSGRVLSVLALLLLAAGVAMRINNALRFRAELGFDAVGNLQYLKHLQTSWSLPSPEAMWSAAHPPLFYYAAASIWRGLRAIGLDDRLLPLLALVLSGVGLLTVFAVVAMARRLSPKDDLRVWLAGGLILFLPVHLYMSPMVGEEILLSMLVSVILIWTAWRLPDPPRLVDVVGIGVFCGLALVTKLSGVLVVGAVAITWLLAAHRRGDLGAVLVPIGLVAALTLAVGGWFYLHNWLSYGYFYPQDLAIHQTMFELPPGKRGLLDYLRVPLATWTDPQLLNPDLLGSVWGSTYTTVYFDGHRHFLPNSEGASRLGGALLTLALLPVAAFFGGLWRGGRRAVGEPGGPDTLWLSMLAITLAGYIAFTVSNPWFVTLKGSYLLGLCVPFAVYASEVLADWLRMPGLRAKALAAGLLAGVLLVSAGFSLGLVFDKQDRGVRKHQQAIEKTRPPVLP